MFCIAGKCYDMKEKRVQALKMFLLSVRIDVACVESVEYMVHNSLLSRDKKNILLSSYLRFEESRSWLQPYYR